MPFHHRDTHTDGGSADTPSPLVCTALGCGGHPRRHVQTPHRRCPGQQSTVLFSHQHRDKSTLNECVYSRACCIRSVHGSAGFPSFDRPVERPTFHFHGVSQTISPPAKIRGAGGWGWNRLSLPLGPRFLCGFCQPCEGPFFAVTPRPLLPPPPKSISKMHEIARLCCRLGGRGGLPPHSTQLSATSLTHALRLPLPQPPRCPWSPTSLLII